MQAAIGGASLANGQPAVARRKVLVPPAVSELVDDQGALCIL